MRLGHRLPLFAAGVTLVTVFAACSFDFDRFAGGRATDAPSTLPEPPAPGADPDRSGPAVPTPVAAPDTDASPADVGAGDAATPQDDAASVTPPIDAGPQLPVACDEPSLVARWKLDETSGTTASDCTTVGADGYVAGGANWVVGHNGGAMEFVQSYVTMGNASKLRIAGAMTVAGWLRIAQFPPVYATYVVGKTNNLFAGGWNVQVLPNAISFSVARGSNNTPCAVSKALSNGVLGSWMHFAGVYSPSGGVTLYVNGAYVGACTTQVPPKILDMPQEFRIGLQPDGVSSSYLRGAVDDVSLWSRALTAGEVAQLASQ